VLIAEHFCDGIDVQFLSCAAAAALVAAAEAAFQAPQTLEHRLDCTGTLQARLEIFGTTQHFLCPHSQLFRASRSHWQDVLCDDLVRTPSTTNSKNGSSSSSSSSRGIYDTVDGKWSARAKLGHLYRRPGGK